MNNASTSSSKPEKKATAERNDISMILAHQGEMEALSSTIANLETLISAKQREVQQAAAAVPSIEHLARTREDLLADFAVGQATAGEVNAFDAKSEAEKLAHQEAQAKAKRIAEDEAQAIAGLQRKLADAQEKLLALHAKDQGLLRNLLMSQAEAAGRDYVQAAKAITAAYLRLTALDGMLKQRGLKPAGIIGGGVPINLPVFQLAACDGQYHPNWPDSIFSDFLAYSSGATDQAAGDLREELQNLGVTLI